MKLSHTMGLTAFAAVLAASGLAMAGTTYSAKGYVTAISDAAGGAICSGFKQAVGNPSNSTVFYAGPSLAGTALAAGATGPSSAKGGAETFVCTTTDAPATLNGSTLHYNCYLNTLSQKSPPTTPLGTIASTYTIGASSAGNYALTVESANTITIGANSCNFTVDAVWTQE